MNALFFNRFGGPDVLQYGPLPDPEPRADHAIVRTKAIGLNFADVYRRNGNYHLAGSPPWILGYEAAGVIEETGERVAFADSPYANAELVSVSLDKLVPLPDAISFEVAASVMLQGLTAQYLVEDSVRIGRGTSVLVHAAAGGVGLLLVQFAKAAGADVSGAVSSEEKARAALEAGADRIFIGDEWTSEKFDVVYDSVGSTLARSLDATRVRGTVVFYGMAGGDPLPVDPRRLMDESKTVTGGDLWNYLTSAEERRSRAARMFAMLERGTLKPRIASTFALSDGAEAHRFLESRAAVGKGLLTP